MKPQMQWLNSVPLCSSHFSLSFFRLFTRNKFLAKVVLLTLQVLVAMWFLAVALSLSSWSEAEYRLSSADPEASTCLASCPTKPALASICSPESFAPCHQLCPTVKCQFVKYTGSQDFSWMQLANVFGLFWGLSFVSAFGELVLAHVFAEWWVILQESTLRLPV